MPFEFIALEALLITLVKSLTHDVDKCLRTKARLLLQIRQSISSRLLTKLLRLKKHIDEVYEAVTGAQVPLSPSPFRARVVFASAVCAYRGPCVGAHTCERG